MDKTKLKLVKEYNLLEDKKIVIWLNVASLILMVPMLALFFGVAVITHPIVQPLVFRDTQTLVFSDIQSIWMIIQPLIILFLVVVVHEGIHGIFFKLFNPKGHVEFGLKSGFAYAVSEGSIYTKGQMNIIGMAPFVIISILFTLAYVFGFMSSVTYVMYAGLHGAMCIGDLWYLYLLTVTHRGTVYVEDTKQGITIYEPLTKG